MYYVYKLIDPRTKRPFYIGKGKGSRKTDHFTEARRAPDKWTNVKKCKHIRSLWDRGLAPDVVVEAQHLSEQEALDLELELIELYGRLCNGTGILTNVHIHNSKSAARGVPVVAYTITGAVIESFPTLTAAAVRYGIHKSTICAALNKRTFSAGGVRWFHPSDEFNYVAPPAHVMVDQFDYSGVLRNTFPSITSASDAIGVSYTLVVDCCNGRQASAGGYQWAYHGERPILPVTQGMERCRLHRELVAYDKAGTKVGVYSTIKEAVLHTQANATGISDCTAGRKKSSGGLCWKWVQKEGG